MAESETFAHLEHMVLGGRGRAPRGARPPRLHGRALRRDRRRVRACATRADDPTAEATELLQDLIRNAVRQRRHGRVGRRVAQRRPARAATSPAAGLDVERYEPQPGRAQPRRPHRGQRSEGAVAAADGPHRRRAGEPRRVEPRPVRRRDRRRLRLGPRRGRHAQRDRDQAVAFRRLADSGFKPKGTLIVPRGRRRGGARHVGRAAGSSSTSATPCTPTTCSPSRAASRSPTPDGPAPAGDGRREGHVLVEAHRARHARARVAAVPHRQRGRHRGRGRAADRRVPAADAGSARRGARFVEGMQYPPEFRDALLEGRRAPRVRRRRCRSACRGSCYSCTHTTFAPTVVHGGTKTNVIPDRVELEVDIRTLPGQTGEPTSTPCCARRSATSPTRSRSRRNDDPSTASPIDTPLWDSLSSGDRPARRGLGAGAVRDGRAAPTTGTSAAPARSATASGCSASASRSRTTPRCSTATTSASTRSRSACAPQLWEAVAEDLLS